MRVRILIFLGLLIMFVSSTDKEIVVERDGFDNTRIGKTKMSTIKRRHLFAHRSKTWRHALFRDEDVSVGVMYYYEKVETKKGITYFFNYEAGQEDPVTLSEILFDERIEARTQSGIRLGKSTFRDVTSVYGEAEYTIKSKVSKCYDDIEFYSNRLIGKDSVDENFVVTSFKIKR